MRTDERVSLAVMELPFSFDGVWQPWEPMAIVISRMTLLRI